MPAQGQQPGTPGAEQTAVAAYTAQNPTPKLTESTGQDGSAWKLETSRENTPAITVRRRLAGESDWSFAIALPPHFDYADGQVVSR